MLNFGVLFRFMYLPQITFLNNSKSYSVPDFLDISFNFFIFLPGIETVKYVSVCVRVCMRARVSYSVIVFDRAINGHDR